MRGGCLLFVLVILTSACGGSTPKAADSASSKPSTEGQRCLEDAETPREPKPDAPRSITVSQILVRHAGLKRPEGATRTAEEACLRTLQALKALKQGASWEDVVQEYSDAPGAGDGSLGRIRADDVEPAFANAAFALEVDELSYVVRTNRGFHIILRRD
jgi:NIMA-interacting peptidyl-prolyl cis-trans isomerase 1